MFQKNIEFAALIAALSLAAFLLSFFFCVASSAAPPPDSNASQGCRQARLKIGASTQTLSTSEQSLFSLEVTRHATTFDCEYVIQMAPIHANSGGQLVLAHEIESSQTVPAQTRWDQTGLLANDRARLELAEGAMSRTIDLRGSVLGDHRFSRFGRYRADLELQLHRSEAGAILDLIDTIQVSVFYDVERRSELSIGAGRSSSTATLDFGRLDTTQVHEQTVDLNLKYNAGVILSASSREGGQLAHNLGVARIPYSLILDGRTLQLTPGIEQILFMESGLSSPEGTTRRLRVQIPRAPQAVSGTYRDEIRLSVTSAE